MAEFKFEFSEGQLNNAIAIAIAETFSGEKRDSLLRDIIRAHLQYKENSYDKETLLTKQIGKKIREIALEKLDFIMDEMAPDIGKVVEQILGSGFRDDVLKKLTTALKSKVITNMWIEVSVKDE